MIMDFTYEHTYKYREYIIRTMIGKIGVKFSL